jgi:DNA invertase Pin-like site-specific DNA recombinase
MRAAAYTRISRDDDGSRLGVERQAEDLRREAERRQADIVLYLEDNDLSGSGKVRRPAYERLIDAITQREVDLVLAHDLDRLNRGLSDYVRFFVACEEARIKVAWIGGEADFATGTGVFELELRASFAREELRKIRSRNRRKALELAENGKVASGGTRAFGYEPDMKTIRPTEAAMVRDAADRVLAGESIRSVCRDWNARSIPTVNRATWAPMVMRRMLVSARISGRRERCTIEGQRRSIGVIVAEAEWSGIISVEQSDSLRHLFADPERRMNGHSTSYLLTGGIAVCGLCGKSLHARPRDGKRSLVCASGPGWDGCGKIRIQNEPLEELMSEAVLQAVDGGALSALLHRTEDRAAANELTAVERKLTELAEDWAADRVTRSEWQAARTALLGRQDALRRRVDAARRSRGLDGLPEPLRAAWPTLPLHRRRAIVAALVANVVVAPGRRGFNRFDADRVSIRWRA